MDWDDQEHPSVEAPLGDFFACGWNSYAQVSSLAVCVNPGQAFSCYWEMPFRGKARITLENRDPDDHAIVYYQVNYVLTAMPDDAAYFHPAFPRAYVPLTTPYAGMPQIIRPDGTYNAQQRFGSYRWHISDPVRSRHPDHHPGLGMAYGEEGQPLLAAPGRHRFRRIRHQALPTVPSPPLPSRDYLEMI